MDSLKLGEMLIGNGIITHEQLEEALEVQKKSGGMIGMILIDLNFIDQDTLTMYLKMQKS